MTDYPLYPRLTEEGEEEAQRIMDSFKPKVLSLVTDLMDDLYCNVSYQIESDHWSNYRNDLMSGFKGYQRGKHGEHDFKELRQAIYKNNKEEIIKDLNQDLIKENSKLKLELRQAYDSLYNQ